MVDLRLRYPAPSVFHCRTVRTFAGGRLRPRPRSFPTEQITAAEGRHCVEPASLCLQRDNVARAPTHQTSTADALINRRSELYYLCEHKILDAVRQSKFFIITVCFKI